MLSIGWAGSFKEPSRLNLLLTLYYSDKLINKSATSDMLEDGTAIANFNGPFRLYSKTDEDVTPKSTLRQAILAVLISSPGQIRGRKLIQEMFWGGVDPKRAAGRLRTALSQLRKDLSFLGADTLRADRRVVSLAPNRINMKMRNGSDQDLLEGMDLPLTNADLFEEWLRDLRASDTGEADLSNTFFVEYPSSSDAPVSLGLLDIHYSEVDEVKIFRAEAFVDSVAVLLSQLSHIAIHDLRGNPRKRENLPVRYNSETTVFLKPVLQNCDGRFHLSLQLLDTVSKEILWVSKTFDLNVEDIEQTVNFVAEQILDRIATVGQSGCAPDLLPWATMCALFSLKPDVIINTEEQLSLICSDDDQRVIKPLQVFAQIFRENEGLAEKQEIDPGSLIDALETIDQSHSLRALSESLLGYSAHMLSSDNDLGAMLVEQSYLRAPKMALNLDHLAVVRLAREDIEGAEKAFQECISTTQLSPWRYTFEVTGAMISLARGDVNRSLMYANAALMRKPKFIGALRYAMVGFAVADKPRDAHIMKTRIRELRPEYDFSVWLENVLRRSAPQFSKTIAQSFERNALI